MKNKYYLFCRNNTVSYLRGYLTRLFLFCMVKRKS